MPDGQRISLTEKETDSQKSNNRQIDNKNVRGYIPKKCDLRCYKCHYQGFCIVPRSLVSTLGHYVRGNKHFHNNVHNGLNILKSILLNSKNYDKSKFLDGYSILRKKYSRHRKRSHYEK